MRYAYILFTLVICCASCNNTATNTNGASTDSTTAAMATAPNTANDTACYVYQTSNDLVALKLHGTGPTITGNLEYAFMGKDKNTGTVTGAMRGDTLVADYTFKSEGKRSVRQVAFLKSGDSFVEGFGDATQEGEKMVFKNTGALKFGSNMVLKKITCNNP